MDEIDILKDVSIRLANAGIDFMLSGSLAMGYYAQPRMTRDIDIVIDLSKASAGILFDLFKTDYYISKEAIDEALRNETMFNVIHQQSVIKVDFIVSKHSEYRIAEFERRKKISINDFETFIVSIEDLVISKIEWMRYSESELQKKDIKNLLKMNMDLNYLENWLSKLNLHSIYSRLKNE